jgi:hypothetical protein
MKAQNDADYEKIHLMKKKLTNNKIKQLKVLIIS